MYHSRAPCTMKHIDPFLRKSVALVWQAIVDFVPVAAISCIICDVLGAPSHYERLLLVVLLVQHIDCPCDEHIDANNHSGHGVFGSVSTFWNSLRDCQYVDFLRE